MDKGYLYDTGDELITREDVNEVPDGSTAHEGDVLELDSNKKPKWTTPEGELPSTGSASVGDVLTLDSDKDPVWSAPSGGGMELTYGIVVTISQDTRVYFFNADGTPKSINSIIEEATDKPVFCVIGTGDIEWASFDDVSFEFVLFSGNPITQSIATYESSCYFVYTQFSLDLSEVVDKTVNYVEVPR